MATPCIKCKHKTVETIDGSNCSKCAHATGNAWPGFEPIENDGPGHGGATCIEPYWVPTKEDQECVDTDSAQLECRCTINPDAMKILLGEPWECKPKHEDKLDALRFAGKALSDGFAAGLNSMNDALVEYCRNDVKATMECFNRLKEDTMPTGNRTAYNLFFDTIAYRPTFPGLPGIKKVIFSNPCTIVLWDDGTKTMVRAQGKERFDREKGLAMAIAKKALGNKGSYYDTFTEHLSKPTAKKKGKKK